MKIVSYIVDIAVFLALISIFETSWLVAFIVSGFVGVFVRAIFEPTFPNDPASAESAPKN